MTAPIQRRGWFPSNKRALESSSAVVASTQQGRGGVEKTDPAHTARLSQVLLLGDPGLRAMAQPVVDLGDQGFDREKNALKDVLEAFRAENGFGRAIAAPQIGIGKRLIALNLGDGPFVIINPEIVWRAPVSCTLWDDCMSFPFLMVRVERARSISVKFINEVGEECEWLEMSTATSELLQHEIDHLDGVLAIDRAVDQQSIISREAYLSRRAYFDQQVDYAIQATI